jgi:hypothetical protein
VASGTGDGVTRDFVFFSLVFRDEGSGLLFAFVFASSNCPTEESDEEEAAWALSFLLEVSWLASSVRHAVLTSAFVSSTQGSSKFPCSSIGILGMAGAY